MRAEQEVQNELSGLTRQIAPLAERFVGGSLEGEDLTRFRSLKGDIERLSGELADVRRTASERSADRQAAQEMIELARSMHAPAGGSAARQVAGERQERRAGLPEGRTWGERFVNSEQFRSYRDHGVGSGGRSQPFALGSLHDTHEEEASRRLGYSPEESRALITTTVVAPLIAPQRLAGIQAPDVRELRMRDVFPQGRTGSNTIEYVQEATRTNGAAEVAEATTLATGLKPESGFTLSEASAPVRTIATLMYITRNALDDADQMQSYIDGMLRQFVAEREDRQLLVGDGVSPNLTGVNVIGGSLNLNGAYYTTTMPSAADRIRRAITRIRIAGKGRASAVIMNPQNVEEIELLKTNGTAGNNEYALPNGGPFGNGAVSTIWGRPIVEHDDQTLNQATVLDGRAAMVFDRMDAQTFITDSNRDLFERNILTILVESRLAFPIFWPGRIAKVALYATA